MIKYKVKNMLKSLLVINLETISNGKNKVLYLNRKEISKELDKQDIESKEIKLYLKHKMIMIIEINIPEEKVKVNSPVIVSEKPYIKKKILNKK